MGEPKVESYRFFLHLASLVPVVMKYIPVL